ncbi:MAG TPA: hypothetical protein VEQ59_15615, partial [Polyangiaceae bacterium]|nr:hypothetical protein [Polyangiaceae bacterium]
MELDPQVWGPVITGVAALSLAWLAFGKKRPEAETKSDPRAAAPTKRKKSKVAAPGAATKPAPEASEAGDVIAAPKAPAAVKSSPPKEGKPATKAIV